ncbi:MAG: HEAT repeat domain-containing protein, partial [Candidatus Acidiferrum sp.]
PSRDRTHGRVYRVTMEDRPLSNSPVIAGEPIEKLLDLLKAPEDRVRYRAKIELGGRDSDKVIAATNHWAANLDKSDPNYEHHMLEALWVHQYHNIVDVDLLKRMLGSPEARARSAATRVLCYWRDRVPDALDLLKKLAADANPRVRLEAVRAASFFPVPEAVEVPIISAGLPSDEYLDFVRGETMRALEPAIKRAIADGRAIPLTSKAGARFFLKSVSMDDLLKMKRNSGVFQELLFRKGVRDEFRREALGGLAKLESKTSLHVLLDAIHSQDEQKDAHDESVEFDLFHLLIDPNTTGLSDARLEVEKLATSAKLPVTRQLGFVALVAADGGVDKAWT